MKFRQLSILLLMMPSSLALAGEADVLEVKIRPLGDNRYVINTTVRHADTGWDHYANAWEVLDEKGAVLGKRVLLHPHVGEQPFTRSHTVTIPQTVRNITVRAHDSVHGVGGKSVTIEVPK